MTEDLLPFALIVGCSPQEFWYEDPNLLWAHRKAYMMTMDARHKDESQSLLTSSWLIGMYVRTAIVSAFNKSVSYPKLPEDASKKDVDQMAIDKARDDSIQIRAIQISNMLARGKKSNKPPSHPMLG